jgi:hypothetical protein
MSTDADLVSSERETIKQYVDWYSQQGYQVSVAPPPRELPEFLRTLAPDIIAHRNGEHVVVEIKTSSPASFERVQRLARALQHRAGWTLQVVYADLPDPEWDPPPRLPEIPDLLARLDSLDNAGEGQDQVRLRFLLLWSIIEAAARHRLAAHKVSPTRRISSSALLKMLLTEGITEEPEYEGLRRGLAVRNAIAHGFLNQSVDTAQLKELHEAAEALLSPPIHRR